MNFFISSTITITSSSCNKIHTCSLIASLALTVEERMDRAWLFCESFGEGIRDGEVEITCLKNCPTKNVCIICSNICIYIYVCVYWYWYDYISYDIDIIWDLDMIWYIFAQIHNIDKIWDAPPTHDSGGQWWPMNKNVSFLGSHLYGTGSIPKYDRVYWLYLG